MSSNSHFQSQTTSATSCTMGQKSKSPQNNQRTFPSLSFHYNHTRKVSLPNNIGCWHSHYLHGQQHHLHHYQPHRQSVLRTTSGTCTTRIKCTITITTVSITITIIIETIGTVCFSSLTRWLNHAGGI